MTSDRNEPKNTDRKADGTFGPGNPGKPRGARTKATKLALGLIDDHAGRLTETLIEAALGGDMVALKVCIERIAPARKDAPIEFDLPQMEAAADAAKAAGSILEAVASGFLTPLEGASVMGLVEQFRRALELSEFENRLTELENR